MLFEFNFRVGTQHIIRETKSTDWEHHYKLLYPVSLYAVIKVIARVRRFRVMAPKIIMSVNVDPVKRRNELLFLNRLRDLIQYLNVVLECHPRYISFH